MNSAELELYRNQANSVFANAKSVEETLALLNRLLLTRAAEVGFPMAAISIEGVKGADDLTKIEAIKNQFFDILERSIISPKTLPDDLENQ